MTRVGGTLRALGVLAALLVTSPRVWAEPEPTRPWAVGVSQADQDRALELFGRGNVMLDQGAFKAAHDVYVQAIAVWDHPAIHYNNAVALINLDKPIDAYQELERALRFPAALEADIYTQALVYQRQWHGRIVHLSLECVDAGTRITLDGVELAVPCPGSFTQLMLPARHHLIATKLGSVTRTIELVPAGGEEPHERIDLMTIEEATVIRRPWARWKPWAVVGAGALVGIAGLIVELQSAATYRSYDNAVADLCPTHPCASLPGVVSDASVEARRENHVAIGLLIGGGATLVTGAVLVWLDRAITEHLGYEHAPLPTATLGRGESTLGLRIAF